MSKETMQATENDEISLKELILKLKEWWYYLLNKWKIILIAGVLGGIFGFTYAYFQKPIYTAETTFVLEDGEGTGGLASYAGISSMVGIDLGGGNNKGLFSGENIFELYKSRLMIEETLLNTAIIKNKKQLLIDRYFDEDTKKEAPEEHNVSKVDFSVSKNKFTIKHDSILNIVVNDIKNNYLVVEKPDKKLSIISVKINSKDELFAKAFLENLVKNVNEFYVRTKTKKSLENVNLLQRQADSVKNVLYKSIGGAALAIDENPNANIAFRSLLVPSQKRQVDVQASSAIYAEIVKNLEISKMTLRKESPLIQVIDEPILPLKKTTLSKNVSFLSGFIISSFLILIYLIVKRLIIKSIS